LGDGGWVKLTSGTVSEGLDDEGDGLVACNDPQVLGLGPYTLNGVWVLDFLEGNTGGSGGNCTVRVD
jgi:hypothetical protein